MKRKLSGRKRPPEGLYKNLKHAKQDEVTHNRKFPGHYTSIQKYDDGSYNLFYSDPGEGLPW